MKVRELSKDDFDNFAKQDKLANPWQTSNYAEAAKTLGYNILYLGFEDNGAIKGATLLLTKMVYLGESVSYAPRGIITDYDNIQVVVSILTTLKTYLANRKIMSITMDPNVIMEVRDSHGVVKDSNYSGQDKKFDVSLHRSEYLPKNPNAKEIRDAIMKKAKFEYRGENFYFEGILPRWYSEIKLPVKTKELLSLLDKRCRNKLRKAAKLGVEIIKDDTKNIENFYEIAKKKTKRPMEYYKALIENNDAAEVYLARINTERYVNNSKILYERELDRNENFSKIIEEKNLRGKSIQKILNKKMESDHIIAGYKEHLVMATNLLKENPGGKFIAYAIVIRSYNKVYIFEDGYDKDYKHIPCINLLRFKILDKYSDDNFESFSFGPITGDFDKQNNKLYGLNVSKLSLAGTAAEYIGEFAVMTNKAMYNLYQASIVDRFKFKI